MYVVYTYAYAWQGTPIMQAARSDHMTAERAKWIDGPDDSHKRKVVLQLDPPSRARLARRCLNGSPNDDSSPGTMGAFSIGLTEQGKRLLLKPKEMRDG